ncbi:hypothetical protein GCM10027286_24010 [Virgibacillus ainsalahensis]
MGHIGFVFVGLFSVRRYKNIPNPRLDWGCCLLNDYENCTPEEQNNSFSKMRNDY